METSFRPWATPGCGTASNGDTWTWNGVEWTELAVSRPPARAYHGISCDTTRDTLVLFGGQGGGGDLADTWEAAPDRNGNGIPDKCELCDAVHRLKAACKFRRGQYVIKASAGVELPEGTSLTFTLDGGDAHVVTLNERGKAGTNWRSDVAGTHEVCIEECRDAGLCRQPVSP